MHAWLRRRNKLSPYHPLIMAKLVPNSVKQEANGREIRELFGTIR
jgi:hypothetical protein